MPGPPQQETNSATRRADSNLEPRQWFGAAGTLLPFVLVLGHALLRAVLPGPPAWRGWDLQDSMSSYYYTDMQHVFVGALCAIGAFLLSYKGEGKKGVWMAGLCAIGAGLCPIRPPNGPITIISGLHFSFAGVLYLTLAYLAIVRFPVADGAPSRRLGPRNRLCRICGWTIVACMLLIAFAQLPFIRAHVGSYRPGFCLESFATIAVGVSWLTRAKEYSTTPIPLQFGHVFESNVGQRPALRRALGPPGAGGLGRRKPTAFPTGSPKYVAVHMKPRTKQ